VIRGSPEVKEDTWNISRTGIAPEITKRVPSGFAWMRWPGFSSPEGSLIFDFERTPVAPSHSRISPDSCTRYKVFPSAVQEPWVTIEEILTRWVVVVENSFSATSPSELINASWGRAGLLNK